jgi:hypothetical protein
MDQKLELLRRVPLFTGLGGRELEEVGRLADEVELPAGRVLTHEGRSADEFFVIVDGSVRIERGGVTVAQLGDGDFLGEIALIDGGPRTATATAERRPLPRRGSPRVPLTARAVPEDPAPVLEAVARRVRASTRTRAPDGLATPTSDRRRDRTVSGGRDPCRRPMSARSRAPPAWTEVAASA